MEQTEKTQGCYQCGDEAGSPLKLCPGCIEKNEKERLRFKQGLSIDKEGAQDPFLYRVVAIPQGQRSTVAILFTALLILTSSLAGVAGLSFSVIFLLLTGFFSLLLICFSLFTLLPESYHVSRMFGVVCTVIWPAVALLGFVNRERFRTLEAEPLIRTMIGAHLVGWLMLVTVVASSKVVGVKLFNPATYWRAAAPNEVAPRAPKPMVRHFE